MTTLNDVIEKLNQTGYSNEQSMEANELYQSGVIVSNPQIQAGANSGGRTVSLPFWADLSKDEPNISDDAVGNRATPLVVEGKEQVARISQLNQAWTATDLAVEVAGSDPLTSVRSRLNTYWAEQFQRRLVASMTGIVADSVANHDSDLIVDKTGTAFSAAGVVRAAQTAGDRKKMFTSLVVHSEIEALMSEQELIEYVKDSEGNLVIPTFKGLQLIIDDEVENDGTTFDCYLLGRGAFGAAAGNPKNALESDRDALACNGGGNEVLVSRTSPIVHPTGFQFTDTSVGGASPTLAELRLAANWDRVMTSRKTLPFAVYRCDLTDAA